MVISTLRDSCPSASRPCFDYIDWVRWARLAPPLLASDRVKSILAHWVTTNN